MSKKTAGRRSRKEAERTRSRILVRAEKLFAKKGYASVTTREIARASNVHHTAVLHHYGSKLKLYRTVLFRFDLELGELIMGAVNTPGATPVMVVERTVDALFDFFLAHREWLVVNTRALVGEGLPKGIPAKDLSWARFTGHWLRQQGFDAASVDIGMLMLSLEGIVTHHVLATARYRHLFDDSIEERALLERARSHVKRAVLATVQSELSSSYQGGRPHVPAVAIASPR